MDKQDSAAAVLNCSGFSFFEGKLKVGKPAVMGVLNVTPDSFSDGGKHLSLGAAVERGLEMVEQGALFIDVGGESTRPGAALVSEEEELLRVLPVIDSLKRQASVLVSVDTSSPVVMQASYDAGVDLINDVRALRRPGAIEVCAKLPVPVCLMHMQGEPESMQNAPTYRNVMEQVIAFLKWRIEECEAGGVSQNRIIVDPGFGFGKSLEHNLSLLKHLKEFELFGAPILVGMSRKTMVGQVLDKTVDQRMIGSLAAAVVAVTNGANIIRVHDVAETVEAIKMTSAVMEAR